MDFEDYAYEMCANPTCYHFIQANMDALDYPDEGYAQYVHLDSGEKEHNHEAAQSGITLQLRHWRKVAPNLFKEYPDGYVGPNSSFFAIDR